jgi:hypothetical protein
VFPRTDIFKWLRVHGWVLVLIAGCGTVFTWLVTDGSFRLLYPESFGSFYDYQAQSLLHRRLDVPWEAISEEAFIVDGKFYGYFGLMPAILRIPFVVLNIGFGELSRLFMLGYFLAFLAAVYCAFVHLHRRVTGAAPSPGGTLLVLLNCGLGSSVLFLASRAYTYHEAILSGLAFSAWGAYFTLRYLERPVWRWMGGALLMGLFAIHCRMTLGMFSILFSGIAALITALAGRGPLMRRWGPCALVAILGLGTLGSFMLVSYAKFGTVDAMPLRYHVQFMMVPGRLLRIDGSDFHIENVQPNAAAYFYSFNAKLSTAFPYLVERGVDRSLYPHSKLDLTEPVLAIPYAMPGLTLMSLLGVLAGAARGGIRRQLVIATGLSVAPVAAVLLLAVACSNRYTCDFIPALSVLSMVGMSSTGRVPMRRAVIAIIGLATAAAMAVNLLAGFNYQGVTVGNVPDEAIQHYQAIAHQFDSWFLGKH